MKRILVALALIGVVGLLVIACAPAPTPVPTAAPPTAAPKATVASSSSSVSSASSSAASSSSAAATKAATAPATTAASSSSASSSTSAAATKAATAPATTAASSSASTSASGARPKVLLSMKGPGSGNPFWAAVEKGAKDAAAASNVDLTVLAPPAETDVQTQISQIEDQIAKGVQAIVVAPTDVAALNPTFDKAKAKNIPVLFVDTKGNWPDALTYIGTDNRAGGKLAGEFICKQLNNTGKVALITGVLSQQTHIDRSGGAEDAFKACGLTVVAKQPADSDRAKGQSVMENILTANPDLKAVFATNDLMALGAFEAIKSAKKTGIIVVGFDANPDAAKSILAGEMTASIAQSPSNMGKFGVENALKAIKGEKLAPTIDTGTLLVDKTNADKYK